MFVTRYQSVLVVFLPLMKQWKCCEYLSRENSKKIYNVASCMLQNLGKFTSVTWCDVTYHATLNLQHLTCHGQSHSENKYSWNSIEGSPLRYWQVASQWKFVINKQKYHFNMKQTCIWRSIILLHNLLSLSISYCIFLLHILKIKPR